MDTGHTGPSSMLAEEEKAFVELIIELGDRVLEQDTFEFMKKEGIAADEFIGWHDEYALGTVIEGLEEKDLAYTESEEETIHYNGSLRGGVEPLKWEHTGFKTIDRQYIYFTEKLEDLYSN